MKQITYSRQAFRDLRSIPNHTAQQIRAKLELYAERPEALANNVKAMQGQRFRGLLRLRVGEWRVMFTENGEVISVERVGRRSEIYRIYR